MTYNIFLDMLYSHCIFDVSILHVILVHNILPYTLDSHSDVSSMYVILVHNILLYMLYPHSDVGPILNIRYIHS